jgi:integrase
MAIRKRRWISRGIAREAWVADYVDQHGDRHIRTFRTKKDADIWMAAARHEIGQGLHTAASRAISVSEAVQRWIEHSEAEGLEFGTIRQRQQHLRLHVLSPSQEFTNLMHSYALQGDHWPCGARC